MTLSARIEAAVAGQEREMLELAFEAVFGLNAFASIAARTHESDQAKDFLKMLNAEAWLDAAMMFLPEDHRNDWVCGWNVEGSGFASIGFDRSVQASNPVLAILSASLKARGL